MKLHPAIKKARAIFKRAGLDCMYVGALSMHVCCREYCSRPLIVDLVLSSMEDKARIDVCEFSSMHPLFAKAMALHGTEFYWGQS